MLAPVLKHTAFLAALLCLAGCSAFAATPRVTPQRGAMDRIVIPPCMSPMPTYVEQWTGGSALPRNTSELLGFRPLVFADVPADMTWSSDVGFSQQWRKEPGPLFHGAYGHLVPRPYNTLGMENILAIDEAPHDFGLLTYMSVNGSQLHVTSQSTTTVNGRSATLFHFAASASGDSSHSVTGIGLLWRTGTLTIRVTAVTAGEYQMVYTASEPFDYFRSWPEASGQRLMTLAASLIPWPGCGGS
jgi:hypothetical protein